MTDIDFANLRIARTFLAPGTPAVCIDVELSLPFVASAFDGVLCLDGLHYVRSKANLLREVDRVVTDHGAWLFAHVHNASGTNRNAGAPLSARSYAQGFSFGERRMLAETTILDGMRSSGSLDLTEEVDEAGLETANALSLIGARDGSLWRRHDNLDRRLTARPELLALNPIYRVHREGDCLVATTAWPSEALREECCAEGDPVPESVRLEAGLVDEIVLANAGLGLTDKVQYLLRRSILVCLPSCYPRTALVSCESRQNSEHLIPA